jgi:signal transduction histidine kinase
MQAKDIFTDTEGQPIKEAKLYGRAITLFGIVRGLSPVGTNSLRLYLECDSFMVTIDVSSCPEALKDISIGCTLSVSGTYIIKADNWRSNNVFPQIREILVAIRKSDDIKIIARPPWWTTGRLLAVIGGLIASLLAIFGWNIALRRRAERRGKELAAEQVAHVTSELKVYERTRLAVELHDSLSQTLTGVSMGIDTAIDLANNMPQNLKRQLEYTSKTVETCRTELRNCLWDLRSEALEATTMNDAIKRSLGQIVNHTSLAVRFNVPRARLSDKTTHMILRIIRELSSNAIRHGNASQLLIAGCIDGDSLHFSVKDNGTGFDPMNTPGVSDGHFGLQGIQERLDLIDGEMKIESAKDRNTKVTVTIKIPGKRKTSGEDINE